jgi:hypothetical protein
MAGVSQHFGPKLDRMDCACGTQLQLHQRDTCAPTHKERLRKLIRLVRNSKNIELIGNNLSVVPHFYQTLPHCIYIQYHSLIKQAELIHSAIGVFLAV